MGHTLYRLLYSTGNYTVLYRLLYSTGQVTLQYCTDYFTALHRLLFNWLHYSTVQITLQYRTGYFTEPYRFFTAQNRLLYNWLHYSTGYFTVLYRLLDSASTLKGLLNQTCRTGTFLQGLTSALLKCSPLMRLSCTSWNGFLSDPKSSKQARHGCEILSLKSLSSILGRHLNQLGRLCQQGILICDCFCQVVIVSQSELLHSQMCRFYDPQPSTQCIAGFR